MHAPVAVFTWESALYHGIGRKGREVPWRKAVADVKVEELQTLVKERLHPYKYPRWVIFVDELPKTASGKIQRFLLRT